MSRCSRFGPTWAGPAATPGDQRTGSVRRADRRLFVLVPDQRPTEHGTPEEADLSGAVAGDRSETSAAGEEPVPRLDQAELVALGIGEHDMGLVRPLADVDVAGAEREQRSTDSCWSSSDVVVRSRWRRLGPVF